MATPEKTKCQGLIRPHLPGVISRVENFCENGMPDINASWAGFDYWIETKYCVNKNKLRDIEKLCRMEQIVWHKKRVLFGARVFVITRYPDKFTVHRALWVGTVFTYKMIMQLEKGGIGGGRGFNWIAFKEDFRKNVKKPTRAKFNGEP